jgi:hypothetical protein
MRLHQLTESKQLNELTYTKPEVQKSPKTGKFWAWVVDNKGTKQAFQGDTAEEAMQKLNSEVLDKHAANVKQASSTNANNSYNTWLTNDIVRNKAGVSNNAPEIWVKLEQGVLIISKTPIDGFRKAKVNPKYGAYGFSVKGSELQNLNLAPSNRYEVKLINQSKDGTMSKFGVEHHSVYYNSYDKLPGGSIQHLPLMNIQQTKRNSQNQGVAEDFNGEYDDEAGMAQSNLRTMARAVNGLIDTIKDNDNLPEWAQEKLAKAEMMTTSVWDYLLSQKEQGMDPKVTEASQRVDSLVTDALRIMRGSSMNDAVQALKTVLGEREYNGRRGHYNFYVRQILDMYSQQGVQEDLDSQFDIIESWVEQLAEQHGVDADVIWEDFEELDDDDLLNESAAWQKKSGKNKNGGLNAKGVASYRREHPGSKLQTAVTTKPSKLKKGSKAAKRRKSFCARMGGMKGAMKDDNGKPTRKALALRKWNC